MKKTWLGIAIAICVTLSLIAIPFSGCAGPTPTTTPTTPTTPTATTPTPTTPTPAGPKIEWRLCQPYGDADTLLYQMADNFVKHATDLSGGRIDIVHYPGDLLGDYTTVQESVIRGDVDMCATWPPGYIDKRWPYVHTMGMAYHNWQQGFEKYEIVPGSEKDNLINEIAEGMGVKIICWNPTGNDNLISTKLFDPMNPGGLKARCHSLLRAERTVRLLGFSPVPLPMSEVPMSLATGAIDASYGCADQEMRIYADSFTYVYFYNFGYTASSWWVNLDVWNALSPGDQEIIQKAIDMALETNLEDFSDSVEDNWNDLLSWQKVVTLPEPYGDSWVTIAEQHQALTEQLAREDGLTEDEIRILTADRPPLPWGLSLDEINYLEGSDILTEKWLIERQGEVITGP